MGVIIGALGLGDVDNFLGCDAEALRRHLGRNPTVTLGEEEALIKAHRNFAQVAGAQGAAAEAEMARRDDRDEIVAELAAAGVDAGAFADVADGMLDGLGAHR